MKSHILLFRIVCVSVILITSNGCIASTVQEAMRDGALAKLNYHIVNSEGMPVSNAFIEVGFYQNKKPGKNPSVKGFTDEKGCFTVSKKCIYDVGFVVKKDGFYRSKGHINLTESDVNPVVKDGKWQPYGRDVKIELCECKNPIAVDVIGFEAEVPKLNELIGYDIKVGDFIAPYGAGVVADFYLMYSYKIWPMRHSDACIKLVFPNALDGAYRKKKDISFSDMRMDYHANTNAVYSKEIVLERKYEAGDIEKKISTELKD